MAYEHLIRTSEFPYHVTVRTNNQEYFKLSHKSCWRILLARVKTVFETYRPEIVSFVLMSNHIHMILWTPFENIDEIMRELLKQFSFSVNQGARRINHVFGSRYRWCLIEKPNYLYNAYRYLYQNPLRAGLTDSVEDYRYSTLFYLYNGISLPFPLADEKAADHGQIPDFPERIAWLNENSGPIEDEILRRALKRRRFKYPRKNEFKATIRSLVDNSPK